MFNDENDAATQADLRRQEALETEVRFMTSGNPRGFQMMIERRFAESGGQPIFSQASDAPLDSAWACRIALEDKINSTAEFYSGLRACGVVVEQLKRGLDVQQRNLGRILKKVDEAEENELVPRARDALNMLRAHTSAKLETIEEQLVPQREAEKLFKDVSRKRDLTVDIQSYIKTDSGTQIVASDVTKISELHHALSNNLVLDYLKRERLLILPTIERKLFDEIIDRIIADVIVGPLAADQSAARAMVKEAVAARPLPAQGWSDKAFGAARSDADINRPGFEAWLTRRTSKYTM